MKTQSVLSQIATPGLSRVGRSGSKGFSDAGGFDQVMNQNLDNDRNTYSMNQDTLVKKDSKEAVYTKRSKVETNDRQPQRTDKTETDVTSNTSEKDVEKASKENAKSPKKAYSKDEAKALTATDDDNIKPEQLLSMLQAMQEAAMDVLDLTQEELDQLLAEQGLTLGDLTNTDALKQLILGANGKTDVMEFLTDGNLADSLHNLTDALKLVQEDFGFQLSEEDFETAVTKLLESESIHQEKPEDISNVSTKEELTENLELRKNLSANQRNQENDIREVNQPSIEVIKVSESESTEQDALNDANSEDSKEAEAGKQFETFLDNLTGSNRETKVEFSGDTVRVVEMREIASQIIERIKVVIKPEQTSMELQLNPEHLGKVQLHVQSKEGSMTAQFIVQSEIAKEAIEGQLHTLKETLELQGIKVEAIEVTVSSNTFNQNSESDQNGQQASKNQNRGQKITLEEAVAMQDGIEAVTSEDSLVGATGNNIDMTA